MQQPPSWDPDRPENAYKSRMKEGQREYIKKWKKTAAGKTSIRRAYTNLRTKAMAQLGTECGCCGSLKELEIDHIEPSSIKTTGAQSYRKILNTKNPKEIFQALCRSCNRWKSEGPFCPCQIWDKRSPGWRR